MHSNNTREKISKLKGFILDREYKSSEYLIYQVRKRRVKFCTLRNAGGCRAFAVTAGATVNPLVLYNTHHFPFHWPMVATGHPHLSHLRCLGHPPSAQTSKTFHWSTLQFMPSGSEVVDLSCMAAPMLPPSPSQLNQTFTYKTHIQKINTLCATQYHPMLLSLPNQHMSYVDSTAFQDNPNPPQTLCSNPIMYRGSRTDTKLSGSSNLGVWCEFEP